MTATNKLRVATIDTAHAIDKARSEVESAVGQPVHAEFQEIEGGNLIIELQLGSETIQTPHLSRLASAVDKAVANIEVLSSWKESASPEPTPRRCPDVMGVGYEPLPQVAQRAFDDDLPTAKWDRANSAWHLAVPSVCSGKAIVGMSHRRGYSHRFTAHDAFALRCGLAPERYRQSLEGEFGDSEVRLAVGTVACVWNHYLRRWTDGFAVAEVLAGGYRLRRLSDDYVFRHVFSTDEVMEERRKVQEPGIDGFHVDRHMAGSRE
jgi:hypothetical protein